MMGVDFRWLDDELHGKDKAYFALLPLRIEEGLDWLIKVNSVDEEVRKAGQRVVGSLAVLERAILEETVRRKGLAYDI